MLLFLKGTDTPKSLLCIENIIFHGDFDKTLRVNTWLNFEIIEISCCYWIFRFFVENRRCLSIKKWHCWTVCKIMGLSVRLKIATPCKVHFIFKCKTFQIVIACELKEKWFKEKNTQKNLEQKIWGILSLKIFSLLW